LAIAPDVNQVLTSDLQLSVKVRDAGAFTQVLQFAALQCFKDRLDCAVGGTVF